MRSFLAGFIFLVFILPASLAMGQVSGTVESVGFGSCFRPDCWTPMVIVVTPETSKTDFYEIHVKLQDLDRDLPIFARKISVTGAAEGQNRQQKFRMYFIPPPVDGGLPDWRDAGVSIKDLQDRLKVSLYDASGKKWICDLPLTMSGNGMPTNVDPKPGPWSQKRGTKFLIAVSDGRSRPMYQDNSMTALLGVLEDVAMVTVHPSDLPENVLGYDAVDGIIWLDADPAALKAGGDEKYRALESYIRRGGRFVISQSPEWQKNLAIEDLLPVKIEGVEEKDDLMPLRELAQPPTSIFQGLSEEMKATDPFAGAKPPFRFARASAKPGAVVDKFMTWKTAADVSPYIVRMPIGLGSVTWVAQDLGDPILTRNKSGWVYVWNRILDLKNEPLPVTAQTSQDSPLKRRYDPGFGMDIGKSLLSGMDLQSKSAWLITLAVVFFIGYWLIAGPGAYTYLAARRRTHMSWFIYGACAFFATALTVLIVKLVLRGPPQLAHFSIVRVAVTPANDQPAEIISRFGLYIPRDGMQKIELKDAAPETVTAISALPIHPFFLEKAPDQNGPEYTVPVVDAVSGQAASVTVPYRSTLKKFQAVWVGDPPNGTVQGSAKLQSQNWISGKVTNGTTQQLHNVYIAFNYPVEGALGGDYVLYLPKWDTGATLDLEKEITTDPDGKRLRIGFLDRPDMTQKNLGRISQDWEPYWLADIKGSTLTNTYDDSSAKVRRTLVMMSLFDRLAPTKNDLNQQPNRIEILRRGGRVLDLSQSLAAGALLVLAEAQGPIPMPLYVEGDRMTGDGTIFYQFVLPLDHSAVASTTQPTQPGSE